MRNLFGPGDPVAEQGLDWSGQLGENVRGQRWHGVFLEAGFLGQAAALVRAGAQDLDIEPPGGIAHDDRGAGFVRAVGRGRVPQAAVEHEHAAGWAAGVYFRGIWGQRIDAIVAGGVVWGSVAAGDKEGAAVFLGKRGQHPQGGQVDRRVGIRRGDVASVVLVEGPVGVPAAALVARVVDRAGGEGDARMMA